MKILFIYPNHRGMNMLPPAIGLLSSCLKREGHNVQLFDTTHYKAVEIDGELDEKDSVNIFLSEGAGLESIISELESQGEKINRDAFGHIRLDEINPGKWFGRQFSKKLMAEKKVMYNHTVDKRSHKWGEGEKLQTIGIEEMPKYIIENLEKYRPLLDF